MSSQTKLLHPLAAGTALLALWIYWYWRMHPLHFSNFLNSRWFFWSRFCVTEWCFVCCCAMVQAWIYSFSYFLIVFLCIWHLSRVPLEVLFFQAVCLCVHACMLTQRHSPTILPLTSLAFVPQKFLDTAMLVVWVFVSLSFANVPVCVSVDRNSGSCIVRRPRWMVCWGAMKT